MEKKMRGFRCMDQERVKQIAKMGGLANSKNRELMVANGKKGGAAVSVDRAHMAAIGRKGGLAPRKNKNVET